MSFIDEVNKIYNQKNQHPKVDLVKIAEDIIKDVKYQFRRYPRIAPVSNGAFRKREMFQVVVCFEIGEDPSRNPETLIAYDYNGLNPCDITYVHFHSKEDYNVVFNHLQRLAAQDGITVSVKRGVVSNFCFLLPKK